MRSPSYLLHYLFLKKPNLDDNQFKKTNGDGLEEISSRRIVIEKKNEAFYAG
jgi:hypothetical protein